AHTRGSSQAGGDARPRHRGRGGAARTPGGAAQCRCPPPGHLRGQLRARHDGGRRAFPTPRGTECALRCRRHRGRVGRAFPARSGGPPMTTAVDTMHEVSHGLTPTTLAHVTGVADLQTRTDRKYLIRSPNGAHSSPGSTSDCGCWRCRDYDSSTTSPSTSTPPICWPTTVTRTVAGCVSRSATEVTWTRHRARWRSRPAEGVARP